MSERVYASLGEIVCDAADLLRATERLTVAEAAAKYRRLHNPGGYSGPWKNEKTPYLVEPMEVLTSREYNGCIFVGSSQGGKTELILNWMAYTAKCDPADFIVYQMSQVAARDFSKRRVDRMFQCSPDLRPLLMGGNDDNVFDKKTRTGAIISISWPSIAEMSSRPIGRVALTDYDRMPQNVDGEGEPFDLGRARTTTFKSAAMVLAESSPGFEVKDPRWMPSTPHEAPPCDGILGLYNRGDRRRWYWPCPRCEHYYEPSFKLLEWANSTDLTEAAESVRMMCPKCRFPTEHSYKSELNAAALWVPDGMRVSRGARLAGTPMRSNVASFWLKGVAAAFKNWRTLTLEYLLAEQAYERTGSQEALKTTINTGQGEPYVPRGVTGVRAPEEMKDRAITAPMRDDGEKRVPLVPENVRFLIATVDVQPNRWEAQIHGVIPNGDRYDLLVIDRFPIIKSKRIDPRTDEHAWVRPGTYLEDWDIVRDEVILREYELEDGSGFMPVKITLIDSGGKDGTTANAYNFWRKMRREGLHHRVQLLKGDKSRPGDPRIRIEFPDAGNAKGAKANARGEIPVLFLNTNVIKDDLNGRLDRDDDGGGRILYPDWLEDEWFVELTGERRTDKGWEKIGNKRRNESWDLLVYALAACLQLGIEKWTWDEESLPGWAKPWPKNSLVRKVDQSRRFTPAQTGTYANFGRLGSALG